METENSSRFTKLERSILRFATLLAAVGGIYGAAVAVKTWLRPTKPVREASRVALSDVHVDKASLGNRKGNDSVTVNFHVQIEGYEGTLLSVFYHLVDAETGRINADRPTPLGLRGVDPGLQNGFPTKGFQVAAKKEYSTGILSVKVPLGPTTWKVVIYITGPDSLDTVGSQDKGKTAASTRMPIFPGSTDVILDRGETEPFTFNPPLR